MVDENGKGPETDCTEEDFCRLELGGEEEVD
jgi:hypothetical protein